MDISVASKIIKWNLKFHLNGIPMLCYPYTSQRTSFSRCILPFWCRSSIPVVLNPNKLSITTVKPSAHNLNIVIIAHISNWEMAIAHLSLWDIKSGLSCWTELEIETSVSEFITPGLARYLLFLMVEIYLFVSIVWNGYLFVRVEVMTMMKDSNDIEAKKKPRLESKDEAAKLMVRVPGLRQ